MNIKLNLIEDHKLVLKLALIIFAATFFILFFFEPFGDIEHGFELIGIARVTSYAATASLTFYFAESYLKTIICYWLKTTIYLPVYWYFLELFIITITIFICRSLWIGLDSVSLHDFVLVVYRVSLIAIIPFFLLMVIIFKSNKLNSDDITVLSSNTKTPEFLNISSKYIYYLKSEENYTTIVFLDNNRLNKKLLRGSLSFFQSQLSINFVRIHRSFIVNLIAIQYANINSQGGDIYLKEGNIKLRISRKYATEFMLKWQSYTN